jgi:hypothetical protein
MKYPEVISKQFFRIEGSRKAKSSLDGGESLRHSPLPVDCGK